jgi:hypothetical protein
MALITVPPTIDSIDPLDQHLVQGDGTSVYRLKVGDKGPGRLAWEFWASHTLLLFKEPEFDLDQFCEWCATPIKDGARKTNGAKLHELRSKWPDLADHIDAVLDGKDA